MSHLPDLEPEAWLVWRPDGRPGITRDTSLPIPSRLDGVGRGPDRAGVLPSGRNISPLEPILLAVKVRKPGLRRHGVPYTDDSLPHSARFLPATAFLSRMNAGVSSGDFL